MFRILSDEKIIETAAKLQTRIGERFPQSGLSEVTADLLQVTREAVVRAEAIRRPNFWLRGGLALVVLLALAGVAHHFLGQPDARTAINELLQFLDASKGIAAYLIAAAVFLITLEVRLKRRRALAAIHELRAIAHIIDMHQLTKDPDRIGVEEGPRMANGRLMTADEVSRYLHYCTELLAIVSKIGQLYVQGFADAAALAAVDQFENLATGLSRKTWQKIMILDRIQAPCAPAPVGTSDASLQAGANV